MPSKSSNRGLGRGFDSLIPTTLVEAEFDPTADTIRTPEGTTARVASDEVLQLDVEKIVPNPHQPRLSFDSAALDDLADSIREHGIIQPLVVINTKDGYQLVAGERRLRAAKLAEIATVPAIVRSLSKQQQLELALIENIQREDLNPIETATSYRKLIDEFNLSNDTIAKRVGKDSSTISNSMRLLNLPIEAKRAVAEGVISESLGRTILSVTDKKKQLRMLELIIEKGWTVRQAEEFARDFKKKTLDTSSAFKRLENRNEATKALSKYLKVPVNVVHTAKGGKLIMKFTSDRDLERIRAIIMRETAK